MTSMQQAAALGSIVLPGRIVGSARTHTAGPGTLQTPDAQIRASLAGRCLSIPSPASGPGSEAGKPGKPVLTVVLQTAVTASSTEAKSTASSTPAPAQATSTSKPPTASAAKAPASTNPPSEPARASPTPPTAAVLASSAVLPALSSTVLARVTRINPRQATVAIHAVDNQPVAAPEGWQGLIRAQDIRATEKDKVKVGESFRPGDVVRAEVISIGDQSNYYLSTARNELGVVMARSERGCWMRPVSWKEFREVRMEGDEVGGENKWGGERRRETRKVAKPGWVDE